MLQYSGCIAEMKAGLYCNRLEGLLESCVAIQCIVLHQAVGGQTISQYKIVLWQWTGRWALARRWLARRARWRQALERKAAARGAYAAGALGARPGRLGWPGLCTRCTRLDFQTGFRLGIFQKSVNEHCSL